MLGIIAALPQEGRAYAGKRLGRNEHLPIAGIGKLYLSGMGEANAVRAAEALLDEGARALVSWGTAGGLIDGLLAGDLLLPRAIHTTSTQYPVCSSWHARLLQELHDLRPHTGPLASTTTILASSDAKQNFSADTGASIAVDMESAAIARVAQQAGRPFIAVRSIVDPAALGIPSCVTNATDAQGKVNLATLTTELLGHPGQLVAMIRLAINFQLALTRLKKVIRRTGPGLAYGYGLG